MGHRYAAEQTGLVGKYRDLRLLPQITLLLHRGSSRADISQNWDKIVYGKTAKASRRKAAILDASSKGDLLEFPEAVKDEVGVALSVAQFGGKHPKAKP